jgi:uncharacterized protein YicC (UPF0701 family)
MPENLRHLETELKSQFKDKVQRGKIECSLKVNASELKTQFSLNQDLVQDLHFAIGQVAEITGMEDRGDILSLLRWPNVLVTEESGDEMLIEARQGFTVAVDQLVEMREREGKQLAGLLDCRLIDIETTVEKLRKETPPPGPEFCCPICQKNEQQLQGIGGQGRSVWCIDHNHETDEFNGWLCHKCNRTLGGFYDDLAILERAVEYVKKVNRKSKIRLT